MTYEYTPQGVCSRKMLIEINDGILTDLKVVADTTVKSGAARISK